MAAHEVKKEEQEVTRGSMQGTRLQVLALSVILGNLDTGHTIIATEIIASYVLIVPNNVTVLSAANRKANMFARSYSDQRMTRTNQNWSRNATTERVMLLRGV